MKHRHNHRTLSRTQSARGMLLKHLARDLLAHGSLVTTAAKAKELRTYFEPLVTKAKTSEGTLSLIQRRFLLQHLDKATITQLAKVAYTHRARPGGYLRLIHLSSARGDAAKMMKVEILS